MTYRDIRRSRLRQATALVLFVLVFLPFTAPFATFDCADVSALTVVDSGDSAKFKASSQEALASPLHVTTVLLALRNPPHDVVVDAEAGSRQPRHAVLRL